MPHSRLTPHYLGCVGHEKREQGIHGRVANEVAGLHRVPLDEVPLASGNQSAKKHSQRLRGRRVGVIAKVLQQVKFMIWIAEVHFAMEWEKGEPLRRGVEGGGR